MVQATGSVSYGPDLSEILGSTLPREFTPPLIVGPPGPCGCGCGLSEETSKGFVFAEFCDVDLRRPLDPWQRWLAIHGLELLPDGRPRFRQLLVLVARQNGKTELLVLLSLWWLYIGEVGLVLGTSTKLDYARESWVKAKNLVARTPALNAQTGKIRESNGEQDLPTLSRVDADTGEVVEASRYKIAASNVEGGRSLTVARLVEDELRQHRDWSAHEAAENAGNAVRDFQAWMISNAGDSRSVVLNSFQDQGVSFIRTGIGDERLGYFGWTAEEGCDPVDPVQLAYSNPNLGLRIDAADLVRKGRRAKSAGGDQLIKFRTEVLCERVRSMVPLKIELDALAACVDPGSRLVGRPVFALDIELDRSAAVIVSGGWRDDGLFHAKVIDYRPGTAWLWPTLNADGSEREPGRVKQLQTRWDPHGWVVNDSGPAGAVIPTMQALEFDDGSWGGVKVIGLTAIDMGNACGHLADLTVSAGWRYPGENPDGVDLVANALEGSTTRTIGDRWAWDRRGETGIAPLVAVTEVLWGLRTIPRPVVPWFGNS